MNPLDWRKAATLVNQHKPESAMAETDQLSSMPLSQIAIDDSGLLVVYYGPHVPVAASTHMGTIAHFHSSQQGDSYQKIIPGIHQGSLYPTLSSLSSGLVVSDTNAQSLSNKVKKGLDQYLQDAEQLHASEANYSDDTARTANTSPMSEMEEQVNQNSQNNLPTAKQESIDETELAINIPESLKKDTGHPLQWQTVPKSTSQQGIDLGGNLQHDQLQDEEEQDTIVHLQQCLEGYPPPSYKQAFLDIYHMLSDKHLYDNPKQHTHCMSLNNEYVAVLKYAICLNIGISMFPTVWAVLSILLDTQDGNLEYVELLQEEYNRYYESKSRKYMEKLEKKSIAIQNRMHDSATHDFDRVSDYTDNGSTPLH